MHVLSIYLIIKMKKKLLDVTKRYINLEIKEQIKGKHILLKRNIENNLLLMVKNAEKLKTQAKKVSYQNKLKLNSAKTKASWKIIGDILGKKI